MKLSFTGFALCALAALCALVLVSEHAPFAVVPILLASAVAAACSLSLRANVLSLLTLVLAGHSPQDNPANDMWVSPLEHAGKWLLRNLSANLDVSALGFAVIDVWLVALVAAALIRKVEAPAPPLLRGAFAAFVLALLAAAVLGRANGGEASIAYWQVRQLMVVPVLSLLLLACIKDARDLRWVGAVIVATAALKALVGIYFYAAHCLPRGITPPYVTTHHDSLHFTVALVLLLAGFLERPSAATRRWLFLLTPLLLTVMVLNNRRLGFISLFMSAALTVALAPRTKAWRGLLRTALVALPLALGYVAVGWNAGSSPWFRPVRVVKSVFEAKTDDSTRAREIENRNLVATIARHPYGIGLGTPFDEVERGPDISRLFALYLHIPHNSVLWMLAAFGPLGFAMLLSPFGVAAYYAARSHARAVTWGARVAAVTALACIFGFFLQSWGDMATRSWTTVILVSCAVAAAARTAAVCGAAEESEPELGGGVA